MITMKLWQTCCLEFERKGHAVFQYMAGRPALDEAAVVTRQVQDLQVAWPPSVTLDLLKI